MNQSVKKSGDLTPEARAKLENLLHNDIKIYEYVKKKFQAQLQQLKSQRKSK